MKLCAFCPKGTKCSGYILHTLVLKLFDVRSASGNSDAIAKSLSRDDLIVLADKGAAARVECWRKCFVLSVVAKIEELATSELPDDDLRMAVEDMIVRMGRLFSKLPKGSALDIPNLVMDIYNHLCETVNEKGLQMVVPVTCISHACMAATRST